MICAEELEDTRAQLRGAESSLQMAVGALEVALQKLHGPSLKTARPLPASLPAALPPPCPVSMAAGCAKLCRCGLVWWSSCGNCVCWWCGHCEWNDMFVKCVCVNIVYGCGGV